MDDQKALGLIEQIWRCSYHWPASWLPAGLHRFITDRQYAKERLDYILLRPVRLYFNQALREQWQGMSQQERSEFREQQRRRWEALTPEQRDKVRERWRSPDARE